MMEPNISLLEHTEIDCDFVKDYRKTQDQYNAVNNYMKEDNACGLVQEDEQTQNHYLGLVYNNKKKFSIIHNPKTNIKILIDTGSTRSYVKQVIGFEIFKNTLEQEPFEVSITQRVS